jgi:uncharacterized protein (TIGR02246 family)
MTIAFNAAAVRGQASNSGAQDKEAIAKNAEAFVEAFHKGDAKALVAFWTADGDYTTQTGRTFKGRDELEKAFQAFFSENKGAKVRIDSESLRFVTPDVAIEDGTTEVLGSENAPPSRTRYTIVHVKKDGKWLVSSVRDAAALANSTSDNLRGLEWMLGDWVGKSETGEIENLSVVWSEDQSFIVVTIRTTLRSVAVAGATHWIGWDPIAKNVRSWLFDAGGGFGDGSWAQDGNRWVIKTTSVLPDGKKGTATYQLSQVDPDTITLQATNRTLDGKPIPDVKEIKFKRAAQP